MTRKSLWVIIAILVLILLCIASIFAGKFALNFYNDVNALRYPAPVAVCDPVLVPMAPVAVCDPSTVPFTDMGELDPYVVTTIEGPAIYEWWTGGSNEGVQRVDVGETITIHGVKGHWWTLNQAGLDCAWNLHVGNYKAKPQHEGKNYNQLVVPPPAEFLK